MLIVYRALANMILVQFGFKSELPIFCVLAVRNKYPKRGSGFQAQCVFFFSLTKVLFRVFTFTFKISVHGLSSGTEIWGLREMLTS